MIPMLYSGGPNEGEPEWVRMPTEGFLKMPQYGIYMQSSVGSCEYFITPSGNLLWHRLARHYGISATRPIVHLTTLLHKVYAPPLSIVHMRYGIGRTVMHDCRGKKWRAEVLRLLAFGG